METTTTVAVPYSGGRRCDGDTVENCTCSEVHHVLNIGNQDVSQTRDAVVVEVASISVTHVNDPMDTVAVQRGGSSSLRVAACIADRTDIFPAIAWELAVLRIYGGQKAPEIYDVQLHPMNCGESCGLFV